MIVSSATGTAPAVSMIPRSAAAPTTTATPAAGAATAGQPPYFSYKVPGHPITTQALKDTSGATWYQTQGGNWRNVATGAVQNGLPTWQQPAAAAPAAAAPAAAPVTPTPATPDPTFKSIRDFIGANDTTYAPQNTYANTPSSITTPTDADRSLYNFQKDEGIKELNAQLSAQGLTGSGAAVDLTGRFLNQLGGQEADREQTLSEDAKNRQLAAYQTSATSADQAAGRQANAAESDVSRYDNDQQIEAERQYRAGNDQWTRSMDVLDRILALDPLKYGYNATTSSASTITQLGNALAQLETAQGQPGAVIQQPNPGPVPTAPPAYAGAAAQGASANDFSSILGSLTGLLRGI